MWTREKAIAALKDHGHYGTDAYDDPNLVDVFDGDGRTVASCEDDGRRGGICNPGMCMTPRERAELIAFVMNDYCEAKS